MHPLRRARGRKPSRRAPRAAAGPRPIASRRVRFRAATCRGSAWRAEQAPEMSSRRRPAGRPAPAGAPRRLRAAQHLAAPTPYTNARPPDMSSPHPTRQPRAEKPLTPPPPAAARRARTLAKHRARRPPRAKSAPRPPLLPPETRPCTPAGHCARPHAARQDCRAALGPHCAPNPPGRPPAATAARERAPRPPRPAVRLGRRPPPCGPPRRAVPRGPAHCCADRLWRQTRAPGRALHGAPACAYCEGHTARASHHSAVPALRPAVT